MYDWSSPYLSDIPPWESVALCLLLWGQEQGKARLVNSSCWLYHLNPLFPFTLLLLEFFGWRYYIFYAYIIAFLQKSTRSNPATFIIFVSNKILIQSLKSCLLKTWVHANLAGSCTFCYSRREQTKASSHQVGEKLSSECCHRCYNGLWLHCESDPENAFFM